MNLIPPQPEVEVDADERIVIPLVDWQTYEKFLDALGERRIFATYDGETLELMSPSQMHEVWGWHLGRFVSTLAEELNLPYRAYGMSTWRRKDIKRGIEADQCFYFRSVPAILGKIEVDLEKDPPPDLVIEIEVSRSVVDRLGIYSAMGVPEIWRFDGETLRVCCLGPKRRYEERDSSIAFPTLDIRKVPELVQPDPTKDNLSLYRTWRAWIRRHLRSPDKKRKGSRDQRRKRPKN